MNFVFVCSGSQSVEWVRMWVLETRRRGWPPNPWTPPPPPWLHPPQGVCQAQDLRAKTLRSAATARLSPHRAQLVPESQQRWGAICKATALAVPRHTTTPGVCNRHSRAQTGGWTALPELAPARQGGPIHLSRTLCCHPGTGVVLWGPAAPV